jgi:hypothetical protein
MLIIVCFSLVETPDLTVSGDFDFKPDLDSGSV